MHNICKKLIDLRNQEEFHNYLSYLGLKIKGKEIKNLKKLFKSENNNFSTLNANHLSEVAGGILHFVIVPKDMSEVYASSGKPFEKCFLTQKGEKFISIPNESLPLDFNTTEKVAYVASVKEPKVVPDEKICFEFVEFSSNVLVNVDAIPKEFTPIIDKVKQTFADGYRLERNDEFNTESCLHCMTDVDEVNLRKILKFL